MCISAGERVSPFLAWLQAQEQRMSIPSDMEQRLGEEALVLGDSPMAQDMLAHRAHAMSGGQALLDMELEDGEVRQGSFEMGLGTAPGIVLIHDPDRFVREHAPSGRLSGSVFSRRVLLVNVPGITPSVLMDYSMLNYLRYFPEESRILELELSSIDIGTNYYLTGTLPPDMFSSDMQYRSVSHWPEEVLRDLQYDRFLIETLFPSMLDSERVSFDISRAAVEENEFSREMHRATQYHDYALWYPLFESFREQGLSLYSFDTFLSSARGQGISLEQIRPVSLTDQWLDVDIRQRTFVAYTTESGDIDFMTLQDWVSNPDGNWVDILSGDEQTEDVRFFSIPEGYAVERAEDGQVTIREVPTYALRQAYVRLLRTEESTGVAENWKQVLDLEQRYGEEVGDIGDANDRFSEARRVVRSMMQDGVDFQQDGADLGQAYEEYSARQASYNAETARLRGEFSEMLALADAGLTEFLRDLRPLVPRMSDNPEALIDLFHEIRNSAAGRRSYVYMSQADLLIKRYLSSEQRFRILEETIRNPPVGETHSDGLHNYYLFAVQQIYENAPVLTPELMSLAEFVVENCETASVGHLGGYLSQMNIPDNLLDRAIALLDRIGDFYDQRYEELRASWIRRDQTTVARLRERQQPGTEPDQSTPLDPETARLRGEFSEMLGSEAYRLGEFLDDVGRLVARMSDNPEALIDLFHEIRNSSAGRRNYVYMIQAYSLIERYLSSEQRFGMLEQAIRNPPSGVTDGDGLHNYYLFSVQHIYENAQELTPELMSLAEFIVENCEAGAVAELTQFLSEMDIPDNLLDRAINLIQRARNFYSERDPYRDSSIRRDDQTLASLRERQQAIQPSTEPVTEPQRVSQRLEELLAVEAFLEILIRTDPRFQNRVRASDMTGNRLRNFEWRRHLEDEIRRGLRSGEEPDRLLERMRPVLNHSLEQLEEESRGSRTRAERAEQGGRTDELERARRSEERRGRR